MSRFADSRGGAVAAINATGDYGRWEQEECHYVIDHGVPGVWLVFCPSKGFGVVINTHTGEAVDEIPEPVWQEQVLPRYEAVTWVGSRVSEWVPRRF